MQVFITGANRGIGFELVKQYRELGNNVIATVRNLENANNLVKLGADVYELDVTSEAACDALADKVSKSIDLLICNAGALNSYESIESRDHSQEAFETVLMTNIAGPYFISRALLPHLKAGIEKKIAIISSNMGSSESTLRSGNAPVYRASKAGATNMSLSLSVGLKESGIAVGSYHPGWVRTQMGGNNADITTLESAAGLIEQFAKLNMSKTGCFENYQGDALAF